MLADQRSTFVPNYRPRLPRQHFLRPQLVDTIATCLRTHQLVLLQAPAGYGKTVLLAEYLDRDLWPAIYLHLESRNQSDTALFHFLAKRIGTVDPGAMQRADRIYRETGRTDAAYRELAQALAEEMDQLVLVLDDYQAAECELVNQKIELFIDHLPANCSLVISSRGRPDLPLARWSAEGRLAMLTERDLRFTRDESMQLVSSILGRALDPWEAELLERDFQGWVLGLVLSADAFRDRPRPDYARFLEQEHGLTRAIHEYLGREVIRGQLSEPAERDFLFRTSILSDLTVDMCNDFLGIQNAGEVLRSLERRGIFVTRRDEAGTTYQYHPTFHHFLRRELRQTYGLSTVQALHLDAAQVYERCESWSQAISHYLVAGAHHAAAGLIEAQGHLLLNGLIASPDVPHMHLLGIWDSLNTLLGWLEMLPPMIIDNHPQLLFLKSRTLLFLASVYCDRGDLERALALANRACSINHPGENGNSYVQQQNMAVQMRVLVARGDFETAKQLGNRWEHLTEPGAFNLGEGGQLASLRGEMALVEQDYGQARVYFQQAGDRPRDLSHLCLVQGNLPEALRLAELEVAASEPSGQPLARTIAQAWLGIATSQLGNTGRGYALLKSAVEFFAEKGLVFWQSGTELHLAWLLARMGQQLLGQHYLASALAYGARVHALNFAFWHPDVIAFACAEALMANLYVDYVVELASHRLKPAQAHFFQPLLRQLPAGTRQQALPLFTALGLPTEAAPLPSNGQSGNSIRLSRDVEFLIAQGRLTDDGAVKLAQAYRLTPREIEVFIWYIDPQIRGEQRRVNAAIATRLSLSESTVRDYISVILKKLNAPGRDRLRLRGWALAEGIVLA